MKKIVIIGAGMAGLSAGCYAQMNGYEAHIFEMNALPGGLCTSWKRKGYTFDNCIHWLSGTSPASAFHRIWRELGAIQDKKIYYKEMSLKVFLKDRVVNFYNDPGRLAGHLKELAPEDGGVIDELAESVRKMYLIDQMPLTKPKELFTMIDRLKMIKSFLPFIRFFKKYMKMTVDEFADRFRNPILRKAITSIKDIAPAGNYFIAVPFMIASKDAGFPQGGSLDFAAGVERRFTGLGGTAHYGAKVRKIMVKDKRAVGIQLEDGQAVDADIVISAADGYRTIFKMLDGKHINRKIRHCYEHEPLVPSQVQVSLGVDLDLSGDADLNGSVYYLYELDEPITIAGEEKKYIHIKNYAFDPTFAPGGKSALVAAFFSEAAYWEKIHRDGEKYRREKKNVETSVRAGLEQVLPGIGEKIEAVDVSTPMTIIRYTGNREGSIMGFINGLVLNLPRTLPGLKNFYMAGQWVGGSGLPGAAGSGREIIEYICAGDKKRFITAAP